MVRRERFETPANHELVGTFPSWRAMLSYQHSDITTCAPESLLGIQSRFRIKTMYSRSDKKVVKLLTCEMKSENTRTARISSTPSVLGRVLHCVRRVKAIQLLRSVSTIISSVTFRINCLLFLKLVTLKFPAKPLATSQLSVTCICWSTSFRAMVICWGYHEH